MTGAGAACSGSTRPGARRPPPRSRATGRGGAAALTAPGAISGWWEAYRYSRDELSSVVEWPALLERAIAHARDGFEVSACQRRMTEGPAAALFEAGAPEAV